MSDFNNENDLDLSIIDDKDEEMIIDMSYFIDIDELFDSFEDFLMDVEMFQLEN